MSVKMIFSKKEGKIMKKLLHEAYKAELNWVQRILFISSTLLGILVSLFQKLTSGSYSVLVMAISVLLLALGILSLTVVFRMYTLAYRDGAGKRLEELIEAHLERRKPNDDISLPKPKTFPYFEKCAYICLALAVLGMATNTILIALNL